MTEWEYGPTHLLAHSQAERTMCGIKRYTAEALPQCLLRWWPAHRVGYDPPLCPECERELT